MKSADSSEQGLVVNITMGNAIIQKDLGQPNSNLMKLNKGRCKSPMSVKQKPLAVVQVENCHAGEVLRAETLWSLCAGTECEPAPALASEKARNLLGCIRRGMASMQREGITPFWCCSLEHTAASLGLYGIRDVKWE